MSEVDLEKELQNAPAAEPLLPIERKLVTYSLVLGVGLLLILFLVTR